jgi:hypothetical protein
VAYLKAEGTVRLPRKQKELNRSSIHWVMA